MKASAVLALATTAAAHYGDPYKLFGCKSDEIRVKINGIPGEICSPPCFTNGTCPTDVPEGVTAKPGCVLSGSDGSKYCALVCTPPGCNREQAKAKGGDAQCGTNASCKKANEDGLCTYDDAPQPPSSAHWKPVNSPTFESLTEAISVGFAPDGTTGFVGSGTNGVGTQILKTTDAGVNWDVVWPDNSTKVKFNLFLAAAAKSDTSAIITGALFDTYTMDGKQFKASINDELDPSQDAKVIKGTGEYALAVNGNKNNGIATSKTGFLWKNIDIGANASVYPVRYGAYPTATTWYVTAGTFPTNNSDTYAFKHINQKLKVHKETAKYHMDLKGTQYYPTGTLSSSATSSTTQSGGVGASAGDDKFTAGIFKTTDGGATWSMVFSDLTSGIYPNGMDCFSADHCVAVLEGASCQILVTTDGGKTWTVANKDTDSACSLTYVSALSDTEAWVGGGHLSALDFEGRFWHTTDGGATWTKEAVKGMYIFDLDFVNPTSGFAVALTEAQGVALYKYQQ